MRTFLIATIFSLVFSSSGLCQEQSSKWQVGTIMGVSRHAAHGKSSGVHEYEVSLKVGKTLYVVLYAPPDGTSTIMHRAGSDLLVLVGPKTIAFNNLMGRKLEAPILRHKSLAPAS